jgi:Methyltransferase domain
LMLDVAIHPRSGPSIRELWNRLQETTTTLRRGKTSHIPSLPLTVFADLKQFLAHLKTFGPIYDERYRLLLEMAKGARPIVTRGHCISCQRMTDFKTDPDAQGLGPGAMPNWREGLICSRCGLNSRTRAAVHLMQSAVGTDRGTRIYLTEQVSALYRWLRRRYPRTVGSEYLRDGTPKGRRNAAGIRHEDLTDLSFADESFDVVVSLEVMEHIPDFRRAFAECARVLAPGGKMLFCVPFHRGPNHSIRARVRDDGSIEHLHPPEYHGDPLAPQGCLCFHHFGWDMLDLLKQAGFGRTAAYSIWSQDFGYLADTGDMLKFIAVK